MVSAALRKRCIHVGCLLWLGATLLHRPSCFGRAKQQPLSELRERSGLAIRKSARGRKLEDGIVLSRQEKILVSKIASASEKRNWPAARSFFAGYVGSAAPVYSAAMHAAFRSREYKDGAKIFEQCQANCEIIHPPVFTAGIRIFAKLGDTSRVDQIWNDALSACEFDDILGSARIAAAADAGNVTMAAETLDEMNRSNLSIQVHHINSAIRACWGEGKSQHNAAKYLFDLLPKFRLTPTIVSFTPLIGAYHTASLQDVLLAYNEMKSLEIEPNSAFAETYMYSLLQARKGIRVEEQLHDTSAERLQAARDALAEFKGSGLRLSRVCADVYKELFVKSVQFKPLPLTSIMHYRHHCLTTPTPQIRGLLTAMAEKAQQAAFESLAPHRDGSLIRAVRLAVAAEKAYDAPKKVNAKAIIELGHTLLRDACLQMNSPRSTISLRPLFLYAQGAPQLDPEKVLCNCMPKFNFP